MCSTRNSWQMWVLLRSHLSLRIIATKLRRQNRNQNHRSASIPTARKKGMRRAQKLSRVDLGHTWREWTLSSHVSGAEFEMMHLPLRWRKHGIEIAARHWARNEEHLLEENEKSHFKVDIAVTRKQITLHCHVWCVRKSMVFNNSGAQCLKPVSSGLSNLPLAPFYDF